MQRPEKSPRNVVTKEEGGEWKKVEEGRLDHWNRGGLPGVVEGFRGV